MALNERHSLGFLVNPGPPPYVDVQKELQELASLHSGKKKMAPPSIQENMRSCLEYFRDRPPSPYSPPSSPAPPIQPQNEISVRYNVSFKRTTLDVLYEYPVGTLIEYPETALGDGCVGHLFRMNPAQWICPSTNIVYSQGPPKGQSKAGQYVDIDLLCDANNQPVRCIERHRTCQGSKVCPHNDIESLTVPHTKATREAIQQRLKKDREQRLQYSTPSRDIFQKTSAYLAALRKVACRRPKFEATILLPTEEELQNRMDEYLFKAQRGYNRPEDLCDGRVFFGIGENGLPAVLCEHYDCTMNKDHLFDQSINNGTYDIDYIEAVLCEDQEEVDRIEEAAMGLGFGPRIARCSTLCNFSSQKAFCPFDHRDEMGKLSQPLMEHLPCSSRFRIFEPIEEDRILCPYILIVTTGPHTHPIPLPSKTPLHIRSKIMELLRDLDADLPDITPRRFIRHPSVKSFLKRELPHIQEPTLSDWHVSLANRSHLGSFIRLAKEEYFPFGTGWEGVLHLQAKERSLPARSKYIRKMIVEDIQPPLLPGEEPAQKQASKDTRLRIIICMMPASSQRLLSKGHYLQSDIHFKRVIGFLEFELATMDRDANTSAIFCRVFTNRQTAHAHKLIFEGIHAIVKEDTGEDLRWRHLHGDHENDFEDLILSFMADQHRGQALGLGLYLQSLAAQMPEQMDLSEPWRTIQSLGPYEHLERCYRLCTQHLSRKIKEIKVPVDVRWLMRSLICIEHDDWEGTIQEIQEKGGKLAQDWVKDKETSKFAFPAICWEKSHIPLVVWKATDRTSNLIEAVHREVNVDGIHGTLVGGLKKGESFDNMKLRTVEMYENYGITPTFKSTHISSNAFFNFKRRDYAQHRDLVNEDLRLEKYNTNVQKSYDSILLLHRTLSEKRGLFSLEDRPDRRQVLWNALQKKEAAMRKLIGLHQKLEEGSVSLEKIGSGKVRLLRFHIDGF